MTTTVPEPAALASTPSVERLRVKIFADGANLDGMLALYRDPRIAGFTTNPTLMRQAGITRLPRVRPRGAGGDPGPLDLVRGLLRRARRDGAAGPRDRVLGRARLRQDPGLEHPRRVDRAADQDAEPGRRQGERDGADDAGAGAGRGRQPGGRRPELHLGVRRARRRHRPRPGPADGGVPSRRCARIPRCELIWASPRELLNVFQADAIGCHIITVTHDVLKKLSLVGKDLDEYSLETVKMFRSDAVAAGFTL